jgi:hypothetical protein
MRIKLIFCLEVKILTCHSNWNVFYSCKKNNEPKINQSINQSEAILFCRLWYDRTRSCDNLNSSYSFNVLSRNQTVFNFIKHFCVNLFTLFCKLDLSIAMKHVLIKWSSLQKESKLMPKMFYEIDPLGEFNKYFTCVTHSPSNIS